MKKTTEKQETLEAALKILTQHIQEINELEKKIDEAWGVTLVTSYIPSNIGKAKGEVAVRRGIEEIEKALGKKAEQEDYIVYLKELHHCGIRFCQYADEKTRVFVKAWKEPPKMMIVEE